jgi:tripeptide aminopeptidase
MPKINSARLLIMRLAAVCVILFAVATLPAQDTSRAIQQVSELTKDPRVQKALLELEVNADATTDEQARITEIPAPPFHESVRGTYLAKLLADAGLEVHTDDAGNVIGERPGTDKNAGDKKSFVLVTAHLDTVFPAGTNVRVRRNAGRLYAPGISDNGTGLAALVAVARAMNDSAIFTRSTILFAADVGEEGEGDLRGIRKLVKTYGSNLRYVIALDGSSTDYIATSALASRRFEVKITGPGGHSWSDFGAPNPIHALARGIARFVNLPVPEKPRTSFNVGLIEGGTSVNSIPDEASIKVDLRSESEPVLGKLEASLRDCMRTGMQDEMAAARARGISTWNDLTIDTKVLGIRPGGELPSNSPLIAAILAADDYLGNRSRFERSSTDANIPLAQGIPAIAIGAGGRSDGAHSLGEWYNPAGREMGLRRILLTLLQVAQLEPPAAK